MNAPTELFAHIPPNILKFALVTLFSLLIGLEQRRLHIKEEIGSLFGTDRTFTLIGILGFILFIISPDNLIPFLGGGFVISLLLTAYYFQKIKIHQKFGLTTLITALITYCLAPLIYTQPAWFVILIVVVVVVLAEIKQTLFEFSKKIDNDEFITLAKFLVLAGVILPLLPNEPLSEAVNISPYKFWLAIVVVSCISYFSYLLKKFVFPDSGIILTGILGGLYSSTATTLILAKKSKESNESHKIAAAIILATTMMYVRLFLLALFFNMELAILLAPYFAIFVIISAALSYYFLKFFNNKQQTLPPQNAIQSPTNPLEFKTALLFAALFVFFDYITGIVNTYYGNSGISILSFIVGVTDIDPFILTLFQGKWTIENSVLGMAVINATTSNNLLKMIYGLSFGHKSMRRPLILGFSILVILGLIISLFFI
ncbi:MAG TPA: hypothetical protein DCG69_06535 [Bacteroidales bacterium]|nr:hypothetical protein [Bacteroidales bacterium]